MNYEENLPASYIDPAGDAPRDYGPDDLGEGDDEECPDDGEPDFTETEDDEGSVTAAG